VRVGFIGVGTMGEPMASYVLVNGHQLTCLPRNAGAAERLKTQGAVVTPDLSELAAQAEIVVLCLPDDAAVEAVIGDLLGLLSSSHVVVDCSTISPKTARHTYESVSITGAGYLDAPVSGGPKGAQSGTLSLMVGGDAEALAKVRPVVDAFGAHIEHVGPSGSGQAVKLCNQLIVGAQMLAICESIRYAQQANIDMAALHNVLRHSTCDGIMLRTRFPIPGVVASSPASNGWRPDFTTSLMLKDIRLFLDELESTGLSGVAATEVCRLLEKNVTAGNGELDWSSMITAM
jgi:3-hydroxyisobutyrate dehydrogenase